MNAVCLKVEQDVTPVVREALEKLGRPDTELTLDFSAVRRIEAGAVGPLEQLAGAAAEKSAKVVLKGVNVDVYKVLKLTRLAPRFSFTN